MLPQQDEDLYDDDDIKKDVNFDAKAFEQQRVWM